MLRTLAINSNKIVLSFGVLIAFLSPKQSKIEESSLESMAKQWKAQKHEEPKFWSFEVLCHKQIQNARRGSKEKSAMKHSWWQSCKPLLEHFLESNLCMLYVVSKLRKSKIQCFKRCMIQSWNEGVTAIASRSLQAEGKFCTTAKSPFCCENVVLLLRKFHSHFAQCNKISPKASRYLRPTFWDFLL